MVRNDPNQCAVSKIPAVWLSAVLILLVVFAVLAPPARAAGRPLALEDLFKITRIADPALSPDGRLVAYTVTTADLEANETASDIWIAPVDGGPARALTTHAAKDRRPAWSPDGKTIAFESKRSGDWQIWLIERDGGEARQFTKIATGASLPVWSPYGGRLAFVSSVFPEHSAKPFRESDALNRALLEEKEKSKVKARLYDHLLVRHWDEWNDGRRKHLFVQPVAGGDPVDLTPGDRDMVPTSSTFSNGTDFAFSPDGKEIAYTVPPAVPDEATSTNHDLYAVPVAGGAPRRLTDNPAADGYPRYSPDGRFIAYRAQTRPGFEADRWQLMLLDRATGKSRSLTEGFDGWVESPIWSPDGRRLFFEAEDRGRVSLFAVPVTGGGVTGILDRHSSRELQIARDGRTLVFVHQSLVRPAEIFRMGTDGRGLAQVTHANDALLTGLDLPGPEEITYEGEGGTKIQAWLFRPPGFDPARRYPLVLNVHGGPQNAWLDGWGFRWNHALWAAQGYVVLAPNPRGSSGFGQKFIDEISRDWGGRAFIDLMKGVDWAEAQPYIDRDRKAAAGASFGGYMMNWFQAQTGGRFKAIVNHCGIFNSVSMYGTTEELWFEEWDHGGTPWDNPEGFEKFSPHRFAGRFNTPTLVVANELDFRVPYSEGLQLFTTLQRRGVPSRLLVFPDEGHLVEKPANSRLWHQTVFEWLARYLR